MPNKRLGMSVYKPNLKRAQTRLNFAGVTGFGDKTKWHSPNATSMFASTMDLEVGQFLLEHNLFNSLEQVWWGCLFRTTDVCVKHQGSPKWQLLLGEDYNVGISWPVDITLHSSCAYRQSTFQILCLGESCDLGSECCRCMCCSVVVVCYVLFW